MGFMGLNSWIESDNAADFHFEMIDVFNRCIAKELKNNANEYNTPGFVNVLLFLKENPTLGKYVNIANRVKIDRSIESDLGYLKIKGGVALVRNWKAIDFEKEF